MNCKDCKHFDNTKPVSTEKNSKYKNPEKYIGMCGFINRPKMMYDICPFFENKEEK